MLKPKEGKLLVMKHGVKPRSSGGIYYPDNSKDNKSRKVLGRVIEVGEGCDLSVGMDIMFNPLAGMELIGGDHFDIDKDGLPSVGFNAGSDERAFCIIDESEVLAIIEDIDIEKIV